MGEGGCARGEERESGEEKQKSGRVASEESFELVFFIGTTRGAPIILGPSKPRSCCIKMAELVRISWYKYP